MTRFYSQVKPTHVDDILPGKILAADASMTASVGGGGKGMLSADIMARISRGWPMPPYHPEDPLVDWEQVATAGYVIHCPLEDDPARTVWWRLDAAGADKTRIAVLDKVKRTKLSSTARPQFSLPDDFGVLRSEIETIGDVRLVVIDPLMSAATTTVSFNQQLRDQILLQAIDLCHTTGVGMWFIHHFTKGTNGGRLANNSQRSLVDYVAGSKGLTDTLRLNTVVVDSPIDPRVKVWKFLKGNGGGGEDMEYMIVASKPNDPDAHIEWKQPQLSVDDPKYREILERRILDELISAHQPMTPQAMVRLVKMSYAIVNETMRAMAESGKLARRRGAYEVRAIEPPRAPARPAGYDPGWER